MPITTPGISDKPRANAGLRPTCDLADMLEWLTEGLGRPPQVLDLTGSSRVRELFPAAAVFSPPPFGRRGPQDVLPYIDASIDIVAVASPTPSLLAEARRVATLAVVDCVPEPRIEWLRDSPAARLPSVSIIVPVFNQWPITKDCLQAIWATVPRWCEIEVIVSDDAASYFTVKSLDPRKESVDVGVVVAGPWVQEIKASVGGEACRSSLAGGE